MMFFFQHAGFSTEILRAVGHKRGIVSIMSKHLENPEKTSQNTKLI